MAKTCANCATGYERGAAGRCRRCYEHRRKYGAEWRQKPPNVRACSSCGELASIEAFGRCKLCYVYWKKHGTERPARFVERLALARLGRKRCRVCRAEKRLSQFHRNQVDCKPCQLDASRRYKAERRAVPQQRHCTECGRPFLASVRKPANCFCSRRCKNRAWKRSNPAARKIIDVRRRMRKRAAYVADVSRSEIFERDQWVCRICRGPVDRSLPPRHPLAASLDHIIPLAKGGTHEPANVQLAHQRCNAAKRDGRRVRVACVPTEASQTV